MDIEITRTLPQSIETEKTILGSLLISAEAVDIAMEILTEAHFIKTANRHIFKAIYELYQKNQVIDIITVSEKLKQLNLLEEAEGDYYLSQLIAMISSPAGIEYYAKIIKEKAELRNVINSSTEIINYCYLPEANMDDCLVKLESISSKQDATQKTPLIKMETAVDTSLKVIEEKYTSNKSGKVVGLRTGFYILDKILGGLRRKKYIILAARPSVGKTAIALKIAYNIAKSGSPVGFISLEMGSDELIERILAFTSTIEGDKIRDGILNDNEYERMIKVSGRIAELPIIFTDDYGLNINRLVSKARILKVKHKIGLLIVDYLQIIPWNGDSENSALTEISRKIKLLAGELDIPIILLSQLSREVTKRANPQPRLSDLRGSGSIEQDADLVMFMWRQWLIDSDTNPNLPFEGKTDLIIAKHRGGKLGHIELYFEQDYVNFINPEEKSIYEQSTPAVPAASARNEPGEEGIPF